MEERTLHVLEYNKIKEMLSSVAVCSETREMCMALSPTDDIYRAKSLLALSDEAVSLLFKKGAPPISPVKNVTGAAKRADAGGALSMGELLAVAHTLRMSRGLKSYFDEDDFPEKFPALSNLFSGLSDNKKLENAIFSAIVSDEEMADDASPTLLAIRRKMRTLHSKIRDVLNNMVHSSTYASYLQEPIVSMRGDRYVIPVKSEHKGNVPGVVHDSSASGATLFIEPMAAVEINNSLRALSGDEKDEIERILLELSGKVAEFSNEITENYKIIVEIDFAFAKGKLAQKMDATMPELNTDGIINIKKGRHPLIDAKKVVPTDIYLGDEFDTLVITGPNTGGKTVSLKTLGLFTLMAQSGLLIPASAGSNIAVFENVFADIGDEQSIEQSLSTFSAHMTNIIKILDNANYNSLILFDELCSGTDPTEGAALAIAILERAKSLGAKVAATTHYSEIKLYALSTERVCNAACEFDVASLRPTYRLLIGVPGKSNAFAISKRLGLGEDIIDRAKELVSGESTRFEDVITSLEQHRAKAQEELDKATEAAAVSMAQKEESEKERARIRAQREKMLQDARRDAKKIYEQAKREADEIVKKMQKLFEESAAGNRAEIEEGRRNLKKALDKAEGKLSEDVFKNKSKKKLDPSKITLGMEVEVTTMNSVGNVMTLPDKKGDLTVQVGILKIKTNVSSLAPCEIQKKKKTAQSYIVGGGHAPRDVKMELDLRGETVDDALLLVDKYLDDASLSHLESVTIIHGKGTGALRSAISDMLRHHPHAKSFRPGKYGEGEAGVTIVEIK